MTWCVVEQRKQEHWKPHLGAGWAGEGKGREEGGGVLACIVLAQKSMGHFSPEAFIREWMIRVLHHIRV